MRVVILNNDASARASVHVYVQHVVVEELFRSDLFHTFQT